ncbi:MAG: thioesterase family protein [Deltaproteobacteria bacterium]|nr:thioesterase family protein [Deltaproteobacteria bacterium]
MAPALGPAADLVVDTTPHARGDGRYLLDLADRWDFLYPSGGVLVTAALRAAALELADDGLRLASTTAIFCEPVKPGPLELEVVVLRRGGAAAPVRIVASANQLRAYEVSATFCRDRPGPDVRGLAMPDVPLPDACPSILDAHPSNPHPRMRFFNQFDVRMARGDRFWLPGWTAGRARQARWFRYRAPQRTADGLDRLALPPIADTLPGAMTQAIGPGDYRFYAPSLDLTVHVVDDTDREWILVDAEVPRARVGWAIGRASLWDDTGRLLAIVSQAMYVRTLTGAPPMVDASDRR